jgi:hypothetical protein
MVIAMEFLQFGEIEKTNKRDYRGDKRLPRSDAGAVGEERPAGASGHASA